MKFLLPFVFIFVFTISLVSAAPPITSEFVGDEGLNIVANVMDYYKTNEGACVQIYVFNQSSGGILNSSEVSCAVTLSDHNGTEILSGSATGDEDHFDMCRAATIVTSEETYSLTIVCNNSVVGGYKTHFFEATSSGVGGVDIVWIIIISLILSIILIVYGFVREEHPPITIGSILLMVTALYIWINGFGILGATELISQFIAASIFLIGATLTIKSLSELK